MQDSVFQIIIVASVVLMTILILIQTRGASLGAGFGGSGELFTARRGVDKTMHQMTIILAVIFVAALVLNIIRG